MGNGGFMSKSNLTTLCYIEKDSKYLMMHRVKKEHDINKDKWVGIGGHFEADESPEECLLREAQEETGLTLTDYRQRGIITFISDRWQTEYMFLYTAAGFEGSITDCNEGVLEWIDKAVKWYALFSCSASVLITPLHSGRGRGVGLSVLSQQRERLYLH